MAAVTVSNREEVTAGSIRFVFAKLTGTITDADTWDTGLKQVIFAIAKPAEAAAAGDDVTITTALPSSTGTLALGIAGTVAAVSAMAVGY